MPVPLTYVLSLYSYLLDRAVNPGFSFGLCPFTLSRAGSGAGRGRKASDVSSRLRNHFNAKK